MTNTFRTTRVLVACYLTLSLLTLVAVILLRGHTGLVTPAVWIRVPIVAATSILMMSFVVRAGRGSPSAYRRLRIVSAVMLIAIAVIIAVPGDFPVWLKVEQAICGLLLLGVVIEENRPATRKDRALAMRRG